MKVLKSFFANIPYNLTDRQNEQMWQTMKAMDRARDALAAMLGN